MRISDWSSDVCSSDLDSGLAGLAVADDQLALTAADGNQRVNGLEAGLYRLMHRLARNDARRFLFDAHALRILDRALAIDGIAKTVDNAAQRSEEHTSELQSLMRISYAVFCLKNKNVQQH